MEDYSIEASIDVIQALKRALYLSKSNIHRPEIHRPAIHKPNIKAEVRTLTHKLDKGSEKLIGVTLKAHDILFKAKTVFPFNLFPDTVTVDREKVTIVNRFFFGVAKINSAPIRDILSVEADVGPLFGSVNITSRYFYTNPHSINFLWRGDALNLQRLLQGYIIVHEQEIDCSKLGTEQLKILLEDLGKGDTD